MLSNSEEEGKLAIENLFRIREQADEAREYLSSGDFSNLGTLLNEAWLMKKGISSNVSNNFLDEMYSRIMSNGATGAKLLGAGGGGFFLVHGDSKLRENLQSEFSSEHRILPLNIDFNGSKIIFNDSRV